MADGKIEIDTSIKTDKLKKDAKEVEKDVKSLAQKAAEAAKKFSDAWEESSAPFTEISSAINLVSDTFSKAIGIIKNYGAALNDMTNAYNTQLRAETQLKIAVQNNPYLDDSSLQQLKDYASQIQGITEYGDEFLMPYMAELASAGRTQQEIMDIISASTDIAASGAMEFGSAVSNLNKTFGGYAGELGETNPKIKALTAEELKNGKAVEVMKKQYAGIAESVTTMTGAATQANNTFGDLKEEIGKITKPAVDGWYNFWNSVWTKGIEVVGNINKALEGIGENIANKSNVSTIISNVNQGTNSEYEKELEIAKELRYFTDEQKQSLISYLENKRTQTKDEQTILNIAKQQVELHRENVRLTQEEKKAANQRAEEEAKSAEETRQRQVAQQEEAQKLDDLVNSYRQSIADEEKKINTEESINGPLTNLEKAQRMYNVRMQGYIDLIVKSNGLITGNSEREKKFREEIIKCSNVIAQYNAEIENQNNVQDFLSKSTDGLISDAEKYVDEVNEQVNGSTKLSDTIQSSIQFLQSQQNTLNLSGNALDEYNKKIDELVKLLEKVKNAEKVNVFISFKDELKDVNDNELSEVESLERQKAEIQKNYAELSKEQQIEVKEQTEQALNKLDKKIAENEKNARYESVSKQLSIVNEFATQYSSIMSSLSDMICTQAENEATVKSAELEKQYADGLISYEEYTKQQEDIEKEAAQKEYEIQMWQWSASLLEIGVNTAQAIVGALSQYPGPVGIALASVMGTLGAVQLAAAIANKPVPPTFATGGIVGGSSYHGDKVQANVNSGEMILNAQQQLALWKAANGQNMNASGGANVTVKNYVANDAKATPQINGNDITLIIEKTVAKKLSDGSLNKSLTSANNLMNGVSYSS